MDITGKRETTKQKTTTMETTIQSNLASIALNQLKY
jgi:hypothetical protein